MQDSREHTPSPGAPGPRPETGADSGPVRLAAAAAGLALLASALVTRDAAATAVGTALGVAGVVLGIVALVRRRRTSARTLVVAFAVIAILWGTLNALGGGSRLLVWPAAKAHQDCTAHALTQASSAQCDQQLSDNVWRHFSGQPVETGAPSPAGSTPTP